MLLILVHPLVAILNRHQFVSGETCVHKAVDKCRGQIVTGRVHRDVQVVGRTQDDVFEPRFVYLE